MSSDCRPPSSEGPPGSCQSCRQRKLKCDRDTKGCFNCRKSESVCYYPTSNRRTKHKRGPYRKAQAERQIELEEAIRVLEHKNERLLKLFDVDTSRLKVDSARVPKEMSAPVFEASDLPMAMTPDLGNLLRNDSFDLPLLEEQVCLRNISCPSSATGASSPSIRDLLNDNPTWQDLVSKSSAWKSPQIPEVKESCLKYWMIYISRVHPVTMILHKPSWDNNFAARCEKQADVDATVESVVSSICLAAVYACNSEEASTFFSEDKLTLQRRHRLATEKALVKVFEADCPSLTALQAFAIYLSIVFHDDNKQIMKDLLKLAMDVAHRMGLDDEHCLRSKSPLSQDSNRRLWWTLCKLCLRSSDRKSLGCYDSSRRLGMQLPLNISDEDILGKDLHFPTPRLERTSMTFNLIEWEIIRLQESLTKGHGADSPAGHDFINPIRAQLDAIEKCHMNLQNMYLCHLDESRPFDWMTLMFTRMHLAKLRLLVEFPADSLEFSQMSEETKVRIFEHSLCILQTLVSLRSEMRITQWSWLFSRLVEWQAMSFVARMLNCSSLSGNSIQAWSLLETLLQDESMQSERWNDLRTLVSHSIRSRTSFQEDAWLHGEAFATYDQNTSFPNEQEGYLGSRINTMPGLDCNLCEPLQSVGISPDALQFSHPQTPDFDVGAMSSPERKVRDDWIEKGWHTSHWWPATPMFEEFVSLQSGGNMLS